MSSVLPTRVVGVVVSIVACAIGSTRVTATTCEDVCPGTGDCVITTNTVVAPGSVLDCSGRNFSVSGPNGFIEVSNGFVTILAHDLTVEPSRHIEADRSSYSPFGIVLKLTGKLDVEGFLRAKDQNGGGLIAVEAEDDITVYVGAGQGLGVRVRGDAPYAAGGRVRLVSRANVVIHDEIIADSGQQGEAPGGSIEIDAVGNIVVNKKLSAFGTTHGGLVRLAAGGTVDVNDLITVEGRGPEGNGGAILLTGARIEVDDLLEAQGGVGHSGGLAEGGTVKLEAGDGGIAINAEIDVTGGEAGSGLGSGAIVAETTGDLQIGGSALLKTKADGNGGDGGDVILMSEGALGIASGAVLDARGHTPGGGTGATVTVTGCDVSIAQGASINVSGYEGGTVELNGRQSLSVGATVDATGADTDGEIMLLHRVDGTCDNDPTVECTDNSDCTSGCATAQCIAAVSTSGGIFTPSAEVARESNLEACD